jgi:hypothetical protein
LKTQQDHTFATITRAEGTSELLVNVWEEFSNVDSHEYKKMVALMNQKEFNRTTLIKTLNDCFLMEGSDPKLGKLGSTLMVDLMSMKRKARHRIYCQKMESLSKAVWFTLIVTKLKDHTKKSFQRIPQCLYKLLAVIHILLMYAWPLTPDLFWILLDRTIDPVDHKEIIVHRTLKAIREYVKISPEQFMSYLDSHGIQPCTELLSQLREMKQQKTRALRAQQLKKTIGLYSPRFASSSHSLIREEGEEAAAAAASRSEGGGGGKGGGGLPQKYLSMIREQSESTNYGVEYNSLTPMRGGAPRRVVFASPGETMPGMVEEGSVSDGGLFSPLGATSPSMTSVSELPDIGDEPIEIGIPRRFNAK